MRKFKDYKINDRLSFKVRLLHWISRHNTFCFLDSNKNADTDPSGLEAQTYELIAAAGIVSELKTGPDPFATVKAFHAQTKDWLFGHLSYDLKNKIEKLRSENPDKVLFPSMYFFQPALIFVLKDHDLKIGYLTNRHSKAAIDSIYEEIIHLTPAPAGKKHPVNIRSNMSKQEYLKAVEKLKDHIHKGDIYEVNFCREFYAEKAVIDPLGIYQKLNAISRAPFAAFYRLKDKYLLSASPERFMKKSGNKIISQPVKGTIRRSADKKEDAALKKALYKDPKERSENAMIVDLVRNDLSRTAKQGSVKVEELYGVYSFLQVHQLISTISAELKSGMHFIDAIKNAFPMGSMTGAPKVKAMELIEKYESTKRGLYSGALGYIAPHGSLSEQADFDFNVVIRSIQYNTKNNYLSFMAGGAITAKSVAENEYEECMLKAKAMFEVLK